MRDEIPVIIFDAQVADNLVAQGDCACANSRKAVRLESVAPSLNSSIVYICNSSLLRIPLNEEYVAVFDLFADSHCVVLNKAALEVLDASWPHPAFVSKGSVTEKAARTLVQLGFLRPVERISEKPDLPDTLVAWLHISGKCNLACSYCYLPYSAEMMSAEIGEAAIESIFRTARHHGYRAIKIKYAGGEATLNFQRVLSIHDRAVELGDAYRISMESVLLSNGIGLRTEMIAELKDRRIPVMISLDGVGLVHDAQRPFASGHGSFEQVAHTVDRLIAAEHPPLVSITVTARNIKDLGNSIEWILDRGLRFSLNFFRESANPAAAKDLNLSESTLIEGMRLAYSTIEQRLPRYSLIDSLLDRTHFAGRHRYACGAGNSYIVVAPNGGIAQCQMKIQEPVANVFVDDPLSSIQSNDSRFRNLPVESRSGCQDCKWRYWCAGGCPLETFRKTGRWDIPSLNCAVYQMFLPEVLKLEGLRLLKYQNC